MLVEFPYYQILQITDRQHYLLTIHGLLFPIEIISHFARILSLTVRLYANMFAGDLVTLAFFSLVPIGIPLVFLFLHFGVAIVQAYVFMLLAIIYLSIATAHEEHEHHEEKVAEPSAAH